MLILPQGGSILDAHFQDELIIALTSHESLNRMWIDEKTLRAEFESDGYKITLTLTVRPFVQIEWSGLRTI
jgi:hypothetical protein